MRRRAVSLLIVPWLLACSDPGPRTIWELVSHPVESIRLYRVMAAFEEAAERKDPEAMVALFEPDAEHWGLVSGRRVQGRDALREVFVAEFSGDSGTEDLGTRLVSLRFVTPDVVLGDLTVLYEDYRLGDRVWPEYREHTFVILRKTGDGWRVAVSAAGGHDDR